MRATADMKIKLDENLPERLVEELALSGHEVETVRMEGLKGCPDLDIWQAAQKERAFLITQDLDFSDIRRFAPGTHFGILLVRLAAPGREILRHIIGEAFRTEDVRSWSRCFVVLTDRKLRVIRPKH